MNSFEEISGFDSLDEYYGQNMIQNGCQKQKREKKN